MKDRYQGYEQRRPKVRVLSATAPHPVLWVLALAAVLAVLWATQAEGKIAPPNLDELEVEVWTGEAHRLPELEQHAVRAIQLIPDSAHAHQLLSHVMVRMFSRNPGDLHLLKQASSLAQQAIELDRTADVGYVALAEVLDLMGNAERGLAVLNDAEVAGIEPSWRFYFTRARLVADTADTDKILNYLETALAFTGSQRRIVVPYVVAILQAEHSGIQLAQKLGEWNERYPSTLLELTQAITLADAGDIKAAHGIYERISQTKPVLKEAKVNNAVLLYRDLNNPARAIALFNDVLTKYEGVLSNSTLAMILAHRGAAYVDVKAYSDASLSFVKSLQTEPDNLAIVDFISKTYRDRDEHRHMAALIRKLNKSLPGRGVFHALLGETLSQHLAEHDNALAAYDNAITLDPNRGDYYNGKGLTFYRMKQYEKALSQFTTASDINPNDATARYNQACMLSLLGRDEEALGNLQEALTLDPRLIATAASDTDFASLRSQKQFQKMVQGVASDNSDVVSH